MKSVGGFETAGQLQLFAKWAAFSRALLCFRVLYRNVVGTKGARLSVTY